MNITIDYKYSYRGVIQSIILEERHDYLDIEDAIEGISVCLKHLKKIKGDGAIHATVCGKCLSVYCKNSEDWENGIVVYVKSEAWNIRDVEKNIPLSGVKKLYRKWLASFDSENAA